MVTSPDGLDGLSLIQHGSNHVLMKSDGKIKFKVEFLGPDLCY